MKKNLKNEENGKSPSEDMIHPDVTVGKNGQNILMFEVNMKTLKGTVLYRLILLAPMEGWWPLAT